MTPGSTLLDQEGGALSREGWQGLEWMCGGSVWRGVRWAGALGLGCGSAGRGRAGSENEEGAVTGEVTRHGA